MWMSSFGSSALNARLCDESPQSGCPGLTPCQAFFACRRKRLRLRRLRSASTSRSCRRGGEQCDESVHVRVLGDQGPVEPTDVFVLAVGVVVAALGAARFVAHQDHWGTEGE